MLQKFLSRHNISTHSIAAAGIAFATAYTGSSTVKNYVDKLILPYPNAATWLGLVIALSMLYKQSKSFLGLQNIAQADLKKSADDAAAKQ